MVMSALLFTMSPIVRAPAIATRSEEPVERFWKDLVITVFPLIGRQSRGL